MLGFLLGTACLIGLIRCVRHSHGTGWASRSGGSYACGTGPRYGRFGRRHRGRYGFGPRAWVASILDRIEATPAQERAVASALADFEKAARRSGDGLRGARRSVAEAFRADSFDEIRLADVLTSLDTAQDGVRKAALDAFARIHGALDERQRSMVADLLEHPWRVHDGGPYRGSDFGGVGDFG